MNRNITFGEAINEALEEEFSRDEKLISFGEDIRLTDGQVVTKSFNKKFAQRIIKTPLVEEMYGAIGLGMNLGGLKPIITLDHGTFIALAFDDIYRLGIWRYRTAEQSGPAVVWRISYGCAGRGPEFDASFLGHVFHLPNIKILTPSSPYHAKGLLKAAIRYDGPVIYFEHKKLYKVAGPIPAEEFIIPLNSSSVVREGKKVSIISWSYMSQRVLSATDKLIREEIDPEIIILHSLNPWDSENIFKSAKKTGRVVIVEEDQLRGGIGAEIGARIAEELPQVRIKRIASKNLPIGNGPYEKYVLPQEEDIIKECIKLAQ